jgi:hypothetical protein
MKNYFLQPVYMFQEHASSLRTSELFKLDQPFTLSSLRHNTTR